MTSEWPPRYFVVECSATSAPSASGCWRYGVAKVLSTTTSAPTRVRRLGRGGDVDDVERRVRRRLEPDELRPLVEVLGEPGRDLLRREEREAIPLRLVHLREHAVDAAVHVVHGDDVIARREQVHERRHRTEPGGERASVRGALERGDALLERRPRRVRDPRVVVALVDADRVLHVRRGLVDRRRDRARRRVRLLSLVDRAGLEVHRARIYVTRLRARRRGSREARERFVGARRVAPGAEHLERPRLPVEARLDATDEAVADEDREDVVAVLALRLRHVHLEAVVEVEERLGAVAVVDEAVERGEERDAVGDRAVGRVRVRLPALPRRAARPSARKRCSARTRSASRSDIVSTSGYQRSARSHSRCFPCAPDDRDDAAAVEDLEHERHARGCPTSGAARRGRGADSCWSSRESIGPLRSSSRRT